jgi:hypothetical protein
MPYTANSIHAASEKFTLNAHVLGVLINRQSRDPITRSHPRLLAHRHLCPAILLAYSEKSFCSQGNV